MMSQGTQIIRDLKQELPRNSVHKRVPVVKVYARQRVARMKTRQPISRFKNKPSVVTAAVAISYLYRKRWMSLGVTRTQSVMSTHTHRSVRAPTFSSYDPNQTWQFGFSACWKSKFYYQMYSPVKALHSLTRGHSFIQRKFRISYTAEFCRLAFSLTTCLYWGGWRGIHLLYQTNFICYFKFIWNYFANQGCRGFCWEATERRKASLRHDKCLVSRFAEETVHKHGCAGEVVDAPRASFVNAEPAKHMTDIKIISFHTTAISEKK